MYSLAAVQVVLRTIAVAAAHVVHDAAVAAQLFIAAVSALHIAGTVGEALLVVGGGVDRAAVYIAAWLAVAKTNAEVTFDLSHKKIL